MRLDYLSVAFRDDFGLLRLQARSMARYLHPDDAGRILVVNNDNDPEEFARRFEAEIRPDYGALAGRVELLDGREMVGLGAGLPGYWRQQILKLRAWTVSRERVVISLDSKNILLRPLSAASFLRPDGRLYGSRRPCRDHLTAGLDYFGVPPERRPAFILNIRTPVPFRTAELAALERAVREREGFGVDGLLARPASRLEPRLYEYLLYGAWLETHAGGIDAHHELVRPGLSLGYWGQPLKTVEDFLARLGNPAFRMIALHRRVAVQPEAVQRGFAAALCRAGLAESEDEALALTAAPRW